MPVSFSGVRYSRATVSITVSPGWKRPFSTSGTNSGHALEYTRMSPSSACSVRSYAPDRTDAAVAIRPTFLFRVALAAAAQVGVTTPRMGRSFSAASVGSAVVDTVPQAISSALMPKLCRNRTSCRA